MLCNILFNIILRYTLSNTIIILKKYGLRKIMVNRVFRALVTCFLCCFFAGPLVMWIVLQTIW